MADNEWNVEAMLEFTMRQKIKNVRTQLGLSWAELAKCSGLSVAYLRNLESGKEKITPEVLEQILDACHYFGEENSAAERKFQSHK